MDAGTALAIGFVLGVIVIMAAKALDRRGPPQFRLKLMLSLQPNTDIKISAKGVKADGTEVDISADELKLEMVNVVDSPGTLDDSNDMLHTGDSGSATINGSVEVDGETFTASADFDIAGDGNGIDHIALEFTPQP